MASFHIINAQNTIKDEFNIVQLSYENNFDQSNGIHLFELEAQFPIIFNKKKSFLIQGVNAELLSISDANYPSIPKNNWHFGYKCGYLHLLKKGYYIYGEIIPYVAFTAQSKLNTSAIRVQFSSIIGKKISKRLTIGLGGVYNLRYSKIFISPLVTFDYRFRKAQIYLRYPDWIYITHAPSADWRYGIEGQLPFLNFTNITNSVDQPLFNSSYQRIKLSLFLRQRIKNDIFFKCNLGLALSTLDYTNHNQKIVDQINKVYMFFQVQLLYIK